MNQTNNTTANIDLAQLDKLEALAPQLRSAARQLRQYLKLAAGTAHWTDSQQSSACDEAAAIIEQARLTSGAPAEPIEIEGLGRMTNEDDGYLTMQFKDEDAACAFMQKYGCSVEVDEMPPMREAGAGAAAPSAEQANIAATSIVRDVCELDYSGEDINEEKMLAVSIDDLLLIASRNIAAISSGAAAKSEQVLYGFNREDLAAVADDLESGYEKSVDVGGSPLDSHNLIDSTATTAAKFIRAALASADAKSEREPTCVECQIPKRANWDACPECGGKEFEQATAAGAGSAQPAALDNCNKCLQNGHWCAKETCTGPATQQAGGAQPRAEGDERALFESAVRRLTHANDKSFERDAEQSDDYFDYVMGTYWSIWKARAALDQGAQAATTASASDDEAMATAFGAWCPYKGSPDPWIVWQDAWRAALARAPLPAQGDSVDKVASAHKAIQFALELAEHENDDAAISFLTAWSTEDHGYLQSNWPDFDRSGAAGAAEQAQPVDDARDAARWRWMRAHWFSFGGVAHSRTTVLGMNLHRVGVAGDTHTLDAAVDAAIADDAAMRANDGAAVGGAK